MELYIRIKNGQPFEHPISGDNFRQAFPEIDVNNLPPEFAKFNRIPRSSLVYAILNNPQPTYQWVNGVVTDVWDITPMTDEQKATKIAEVKAVLHPEGWVFNETACEWQLTQE
jgi:hypothetical protein